MSPESQLPDKIGRYPVVRLLGRGAMGSVYLARDTELDRDVAIKTVRLPNAPDEAEGFLVRFRNEARAVGRLKHPSIVGVYDVGNDSVAGPYLVFEYVEGSNLKDILRTKGPLGPDQVIALSEQVGGALDAAHREGIIHRDIKPENLLVGKDGAIRLADFGVARVPDAALTGEGQFLGTPCYGAPETLRGGLSGPLSDQFSFAAVLYECVSGVRAFPGSDALAVAHRVIHEEPPPPSEVAVPGAVVPKALDAVILRGLSKVPQNRFDHLSTLLAALRRAYGLGVGGGDLADTVPAMRAGRSSIASAPPPPPEKKKLPLWPFAAALGLGLFAVMQLAPSAPAAEAPADAVETPRTSPKGGDGPNPDLDDKTDEAAAAVDPTADAELGAGRAAPDAGAATAKLPPGSTLSAFEREERAKDALERAQRAIETGDAAGAKAALDEAEGYDPEHPEIDVLRRRL